MLGNDISNGVPLRALVHLDVVTVTLEEKEKFLKVFTRTVERTFFDKVVISQLWRFSENHNCVMDLFTTEGSQGELDEMIETLDQQQAHPFRSGIVYPSIRALVSTLPYRHDLLGVIDLPERGLRYGSRWIDLTQF